MTRPGDDPTGASGVDGAVTGPALKGRALRGSCAGYSDRPMTDLAPPTSPAAARGRRRAPVWAAVLAAVALPGLGYAVLGERTRGAVAGVTVLLLFVAGLLVGGVRVVDVPGYDERGGRQVVAGSDGGPAWVLTSRPVAAVLAKPWAVPQLLVGPAGWIAAKASLDVAAAGYPRTHARVAEVGTLYTAVAGGLNLLLVIDAAYRAGRD